MSALTWRRSGVIVAFVLLIVGLVAGGVATATIIYVDASATGADDGLLWADAYTDLQTALATAGSGDEIYVAAGIYYPGTTQTSCFYLRNGVALYGGYTTDGETRDVANNVTVLSGDVDHDTNPDTTDGNGVVTDTSNIKGNNAYHVVTSSGNDSTAVLDGFTITGGGGSPTAGAAGCTTKTTPRRRSRTAPSAVTALTIVAAGCSTTTPRRRSRTAPSAITAPMKAAGCTTTTPRPS